MRRRGGLQVRGGCWDGRGSDKLVALDGVCFGIGLCLLACYVVTWCMGFMAFGVCLDIYGYNYLLNLKG